MIEREELRKLLKKVELKNETIERIMSKKIKTLLSLGQAEEIERIFEVLENMI